ncbi:MAG: hypothetical protein Q9218_006544 [Villophora microphyllina]
MEIDSQACVEKLLAELLDGYDRRYGLGTMTCSVYDTAWVANVVKTVVGVPQYLFPSAFRFVLDAQLPDGSWNAHYDTEDANEYVLSPTKTAQNLSDSILSTMAALHTLNVHLASPYQIRPEQLPAPPLCNRISRAASRLRSMLDTWRISDCNAVGFEVLVPALLSTLDTQGFNFDFPDRARLLQIRAVKVDRVQPLLERKKVPMALLHSFEALHDWSTEAFDAKNMKHHLINGSLMASPAATASYLMRSPTWNDEAEAYLRLVTERGEGRGKGGVPSAWPSTNFEILWDSVTSSQVANTTTTTLTHNRLGPGIEPDLDDCAKASIILSLSGKSGFSESIVRHFDAPRCLKTYPAERDPSVSANCNALLSMLLDNGNYSSKVEMIGRIAVFVCDSWTESKGAIKDKWNLSPYYPTMVMARALTELLHPGSAAGLATRQSTSLMEKVATILSECLRKTLQSQHTDGSWGIIGPREETAYAILILVSLISLPLARSLRKQATVALQRGRKALRNLAGRKPEYLWIEKVSYGSKSLAETYVVPAMHTSIGPPTESKRERPQQARGVKRKRTAPVSISKRLRGL